MNGVSSNIGVSFNTAAVAVAAGNGIKTTYIPPSYDDFTQTDYSDPVVDIVEGKDIFNSYLSSWFGEGVIAGKAAGKFIIDKGTNVALWAATKGGLAKSIGNVISKIPDISKTTTGLLVSIPIFEAVYKPFLAMVADMSNGGLKHFSNYAGIFASGFLKAETSGIFKTTKVFENAFKAIKFPGLKADAIKELLSKISRNDLFKLMPKADILKGFSSSLLAGIGIDYIASLVANLGKTFVTDLTDDGKINTEGYFSGKNMKWGSSFLKTSTKLIGSVAGELVGGPVGKVVGTTIGASFAEFQVAMFTDENGKIDEKWCAIAGGAELVGAVAGVAVLLICATGPVGAVAVAVAAVVGALVAFTLSWVGYLVDRANNTKVVASETASFSCGWT